MKRNLFIGIIIVLVIGGVLGVVKFLQIKTMIAFGASFVPPPETVATAVARTDSWPEILPAVGSVDPIQGINISAEIAGTIREIEFPDGASVNQGDLIVKLDTSSEAAQLKAIEAQVELTRLTLERSRRLLTNNAISQSELDQANAALKQNEANADAIRATIAKKNIRAPFTGKLGIWQVSLGQFVDIGRALIPLQSLAPLYVDFSLPQSELSQIATGMVVRVTTDSYPGQKFSGTLAAINPNLDTTTRNVQLRSVFANTNELLRPGMFVRVELLLPQAQNVLAVPATAILSAPYGDSVFLVEPKVKNGATNLIVQQKFIRTGRVLGDFISVESGLNAGDKVATAGIFKLRNGMSVQENNVDTPKPSLNPTPPNS